MAYKYFKMWQYNNNYGGQHWNSWDVTLISDAFEWMVTVAIPDTYWGDTPLNVDGEQRVPKQIFVVGAKPVVPPPTPTYERIATFIEGAEATFYGFDSYADMPTPGYVGANSSIGSTCAGLYDEPDYTFNSRQEFYAALANGDIVPVKPRVYFDVYINGIDKPSLFVNWTAEDEIPISSLTPRVWIECQAAIPLVPEVIEIDGLMQPNTSAWNVSSAGGFTYAGSYETTYLSIEQNFEKYLNAVSKLEQWGFNGEPEFVNLFLRMDDVNGFGDLAKVSITKAGEGSSEMIANSSDIDDYDTIVRIHYGEPDYVLPQDGDDYPDGSNITGDEDGRYDPDNPTDPTDFDDSTGIGFDGNAVLTKTYAVSAATLRNIGQKLWSQDYFNVLKIQNNPIENVIALKHFPFAMTGTSEEVKIGDVPFGVNGDKVASVQKKLIGTVKYTGKFGNYLDFGPYTAVKINLPYIGLVQLDPADIFNSLLKVEYVIDLVTGQCMAILTLDGIPFMNVYGQMGVDIPLTSSDRVQTELRAASSAITAMNASAGQIIAGDVAGGTVTGISNALNIAGADYTTQRTSSQSPACSSFENHKVYMLIERPLYNPESEGYKHLHGYPCHKYKSILEVDPTTKKQKYNFPPGTFVQMDRRTDINIAMTSEENRMLEQLLLTGVYV